MTKPSFKLEIFEGPLDLLLLLIRKNKVSIYDIPIAQITDQYIEYINQMEKMDLDISGKFLVLASQLLYIKSKMLLPKHEEDEEEEDPRQELVQRLEEYKKYKGVLSFFDQRKNIGDYLFFKFPDELEQQKPENENIPFYRLFEALNRVLKRQECNLALSSEDAFKGIITTGQVSVRSKVSSIKQRLKKKKKIKFLELFSDSKSKSEIVAIFLAVLELVKLEKILINYNKDNIILENLN